MRFGFPRPLYVSLSYCTPSCGERRDDDSRTCTGKHCTGAPTELGCWRCASVPALRAWVVPAGWPPSPSGRSRGTACVYGLLLEHAPVPTTDGVSADGRSLVQRLHARAAAVAAPRPGSGLVFVLTSTAILVAAGFCWPASGEWCRSAVVAVACLWERSFRGACESSWGRRGASCAPGSADPVAAGRTAAWFLAKAPPSDARCLRFLLPPRRCIACAPLLWA